MNNNYVLQEDLLKDKLINKMLIVSSILITIAYISAQIRAFEIGWSLRDLFQTLAWLVILTPAVFRKRLGVFTKATIVIIAFTLGSIPGVYTLGILGGTIFLFPTTAVLIAIFYSSKASSLFIIISLAFLTWIAYRFISGNAVLSHSADFFITNIFHWVVYLLCVAFFFIVSCQTIHSFRKTMELQLETIKSQRDELSKINKELVDASQNIKKLQGMLPICSSCKKIRDDKGYWNQIESYIKQHSDAEFSHGICPDCAQKLYGEFYKSRNDKDTKS